MELKTKSKRPEMNCSIDVFYDEAQGFSSYINDSATYKAVLVESGSFVMEENGEYRVITAPAAMAINEKADLKIVSESGVVTGTVYFKPTFIREEFTFDAIASGKYDKFSAAVENGDQMNPGELMYSAIRGVGAEFGNDFKDSIHQDALLLLEFTWHRRNVVIYSLTEQEYAAAVRICRSLKYELEQQPDNFWLLRTRYFLITLLFTATADFYRDSRQDEIYKDPLVAKVARYMWENIGNDISLSDILKEFSINKNALNEAFNNEKSMSCMAYLEQLRMNFANKLLQFTDYSVSEVGNICGYPDANYFSKVFKKHMGMSASEYQKHMKGLC
ncbi:MAG: helix-turn-helix transcriptional regulator [Clostridiales bacterium]|nr:helix-turn-helix transcriptional regulator [Clostridiales bacterium]